MKLLTSVPSSWSIKKTMEEFTISQYMVKREREINSEKGILEEPGVTTHAGTGAPQKITCPATSGANNFFSKRDVSNLKSDYVALTKSCITIIQK